MSVNDNFQLLVVTEGLAPGERLWFGEGLMGPLCTAADVLMEARLIADWSIACAGCHPKDTQEYLEKEQVTIVRNEAMVALLIAGLAHTPPPAPFDPTNILDA